MHTALVWFRQDLRLADNPALQAAVASGASIVPVFIWSPAEEGDWAPGAASRWWLHQSLQRLHESLEQRGSQLIVRQGPALQALCELAADTGATAVYWNRRYEPAAVAIETTLRQSLPAAGLAAHSYQSALLCEPWTVQTGTGGPYQVFTPYWRTWLQQVKVPAPTASPEALATPVRWPHSVPLTALKLQSALPWSASLAEHWTPGEAQARQQLLPG